MSEHDFRVYAKGSSFTDEVYDLRALELLIKNYRAIADRLIAVQLGRRQLTPAIKNQIEYQTKVKSGSIELLIEFAFTHKELIAAIATLDGGKQLSSVIAKLLKDAIDLRKKVAEFLKKGLPINININNNINIGSNNVIANFDSGNIEISEPKILWAAQVTKYPVDRLVSGVDGKAIEYIDLGSGTENTRITTDEHEILGQEREELSATSTIVGRLDVIAFSSHKGTVVSNSEKFPVTWEDEIRSKVQQYADVEGIEFKVRQIIDKKNLKTEAIAFHILDCKKPQSEMKIDD